MEIIPIPPRSDPPATAAKLDVLACWVDGLLELTAKAGTGPGDLDDFLLLSCVDVGTTDCCFFCWPACCCFCWAAWGGGGATMEARGFATVGATVAANATGPACFLAESAACVEESWASAGTELPPAAAAKLVMSG